MSGRTMSEVWTETSRPVRWGILSTARVNALVIPGLHESPETELVAVASRTPERASEYGRSWGIPRAYGSYDALLADPDVEAVYISLPNGPHVEWSIRALEAGKHVLCEKPLARLPADVERAFDTAERTGMLLMEAFMWRHHPQTARLLELVRGGAVGDLRLVRASFSFTLGARDVRLDPALAGGALMDVGCYCVDGSRLLAGEPLTAVARQLTGPSGVDVRLAGVLVFPGDVLAQVDCAFDLPPRQGLEVVGAEGTLYVRTPWGCHRPGIELARGHDRQFFAIEQADRYRLQAGNFSRAIRGLEPPLLGRPDAVGQARSIDALYRSAEAGGEPAQVAAS
jgi:D-xylose 1-dehydrogenase (NADP+, D-xylono-1,5-lactone-forming)